MPASAGPSGRMPSNNRLSVSDSLKTHDIWQKAVGYDPYAGGDEGGAQDSHMIQDVGEINSSAKGLFRLAQLTGNSSTLAPGACKKCGQVGHLYFQCRNTLAASGKKKHLQEELPEEDEEDDLDSDAAASEEESSDSDDDSDDSDDSEEETSDSDESPRQPARREHAFTEADFEREDFREATPLWVRIALEKRRENMEVRARASPGKDESPGNTGESSSDP
mmetsp:Transcript_12962/g.38561  ORF Transcript_12962/g.38561 Transcript_12962/m.38561 type:complete len:221 (-) Transcript_12962:162-824(-)